jgi:hypothetical protein
MSRMLSVLGEGTSFALVQRNRANPILRRLRYRDGFGNGRVRAGSDLNTDLLRVRVGVLLALEGLNVALAFKRIVDDPSLFAFTRAGDPLAFADRHVQPLAHPKGGIACCKDSAASTSIGRSGAYVVRECLTVDQEVGGSSPPSCTRINSIFSTLLRGKCDGADPQQ